MKTKLLKKTGASVMLLVLVSSFLLFSPQVLSNVDKNEVNLLKQDINSQDSIIIIVGKVVDLDHQPLEAVVVRDNSTTVEKLTNDDGGFELSLDTASVISFTKTGFYSVEHKVNKSDSSLVIILTPDSDQLIVKGYGFPIEKNEQEEWLDLDTISTLKVKYELLNNSTDNDSIKMDKWEDKNDSTYIEKKKLMHLNDSLKNIKEKHIE